MSEIIELFSYFSQRYIEFDPSTKCIITVGIINILVGMITFSISIALDLGDTLFNH